MAKQRTYDPTVKASAMAALLQGQSVASVAREYKVPRGTASSWRKQAQRDAFGGESKSTQKEQIGDLLVQYLEANIITLKTQAEAFRDKDWIAKQGAAEMATLHGVMTDKAVRLIEAFGEAEE